MYTVILLWHVSGCGPLSLNQTTVAKKNKIQSLSHDTRRVSKNTCHFFLNNFVKHRPILIIFDMRHKKET